MVEVPDTYQVTHEYTDSGGRKSHTVVFLLLVISGLDLIYYSAIMQVIIMSGD